MATMFLGGPMLKWEALETRPEPESPDGTPYWKSAESGYPGAIVEPEPEPEPEPELEPEPEPVVEPQPEPPADDEVPVETAEVSN
ncbi:hypothetical protein ACFWPK_26940 [Nocardia sp. NPDC058519]|uniref:hypothetical protein n=1 Tax=Nocardia sp. NPDC058519 TaxID=3346535 RepID=UPI0036558E10